MKKEIELFVEKMNALMDKIDIQDEDMRQEILMDAITKYPSVLDNVNEDDEFDDIITSRIIDPIMGTYFKHIKTNGLISIISSLDENTPSPADESNYLSRLMQNKTSIYDIDSIKSIAKSISYIHKWMVDAILDERSDSYIALHMGTTTDKVNEIKNGILLDIRNAIYKTNDN